MKSLLRVLQFAANLWPYYIVIAITSVLVALANQAVPFVVKGAVDTIVATIEGATPDYALIMWLAVAFLASDVAVTLLSNFGGYYGDIMTVKLRKQLSERYYQQLLSLPQRYYDNELTGTIINRLNRTITEVSSFLHFFANNFLQMILTMVFTLVVVAYYSWEVAILLFIIYPLFIWLTALTSKKWQEFERQKNQKYDAAHGRFAEVVSQIKVVKSFAQEHREQTVFSGTLHNTIGTTRHQSALWHRMDMWRRLALNGLFFVIIGYVFWQTLGGRFSVGEMFLLVQFSQLMRLPLFSMSFFVDQTQRAIAGSKDYFAVMDITPESPDTSTASDISHIKGAVVYNNVSFAYQHDEPVLHNIAFTVKPGEKVAFVGQSGEGKSTLANLLLRLYDPTAGVITIDGKNIAHITQSSLRQHIAVVFQEPALFSGTVADNIAYAKPQATAEEIELAARAANAHDFITKLPQAYESLIGEKGVRLSGGQKQRIAIARALLKDAPILVLDEATSSLDSKSEAQVQQALERLMRGRTTLIIAHRLSTIAHVDTIITIKNGRIDEIGSPADLAKTHGIYHQLLGLQTGTTEQARKKLKQFDIAA